jgi:DUF218 domain
MERRSRNTFENAIYSKELIRPNSVGRWLLVTAAGHMPRAVGCFRRAGFKVLSPIRYRARGFGSSALARLDAAMKEWIGLISYRITGLQFIHGRRMRLRLHRKFSLLTRKMNPERVPGPKRKSVVGILTPMLIESILNPLLRKRQLTSRRFGKLHLAQPCG